MCGLCDKDIKPLISSSRPADPVGREETNNKAPEYVHYCIEFSKTGRGRFLSHLETVKVFERAFRRSGLNIKMSSGYHPIPVLKFSRALPLGIESEKERLIIESEKNRTPSDISNSLNRTLPEGFSIKRTFKTEKDRVSKLLNEGRFAYTVFMDKSAISLDKVRHLLKEFVSAETFRIIKKTKKAVREVDLKELILDIELSDANLSFTLDETKQLINPLLIVEKIFGNYLDFAQNVRIKKTEVR
jgi:radical SAM-linked protein